jgi:hypothetical protein
MGILIPVTTHTKIRSHIKNPSFDGYLITVKTRTKIRSHIKNPSFDGYFDNRYNPYQD